MPIRFTGDLHLLSEDSDLLAVDDKLAIGGVDITLEVAVYGVVLEHVDHVLEVNEAVR